MRISVKCPVCHVSFNMDASFIGVKRKCPECEHSFFLQDENADGLAQTNEIGPPTMGCPECGRFFKDTGHLLTKGDSHILCVLCSQSISREAATALGKSLKYLDHEVLETLLYGESPVAVMRKLHEKGMTEEGIQNIVSKHMRKLPFERYKEACEGNCKLAIPDTCDLCNKELTTDDKTTCLYVHWVGPPPNQDEDNEICSEAILLTGTAACLHSWIGGLMKRLFGRTVGGIISTEGAQEMHALYVSCKTCEAEVSKGKYEGFPANHDFKSRKVTVHSVKHGRIPLLKN